MQKNIYTLAIETSCDDTSIAIMQNGRNIIATNTNSQIPIHNLYGGVVPEIASRNHLHDITPLTEKTLKDAKMTLDDIDYIAVTEGPGLIGSLLVGVNFAKTLAYASKKPLVAVNHLLGHIAANYISHKELEPPFLALVASGGHSNIIETRDYLESEIILQSSDDAAGEAYDKISRSLDLGYPGGPAIQKAAEQGDKNSYPLPIAATKDGSYSFSGIKSAVLNLLNSAKMKKEEININNLAASVQFAINTALTQNFIFLAKKLSYKTLVLAGGVSANKNLREMIEEQCVKENLKLYYPQISLTGDNAAMIGCQSYYNFLAGNFAPLSLNPHCVKNTI